MKLDPLSIVLDQGLRLNKKFYFISGNEKSFIEKIKKKIIEKYRTNENISLLILTLLMTMLMGLVYLKIKK